GDPIYAVIKGGAINHGGQAGGLTVPHPGRQAELLVAAYADAKVDPSSISYIEAHGTGTSLGDPIEVQGIKKALPQAACGLGSIKTNLGHLEAAAGITGLLKLALSLQHRTLPASLHFSQLNPKIDLTQTGLYIVDTARPWDSDNQPRRAGVSSFGSGGTNAHVVVEECRALAPVHVNAGPALIPLSAKTEAQLQRYARKLLDFVQGKQEDLDLAQLAYTLQAGRVAMDERVAFIANDAAELCSQLQAFTQGAEVKACYRAKADKAAVALFGDDAQDLVHKWQVLGFNWNALYGSARPRRISAPTYPFAQQRHWLAEHIALPAQGSPLHPLVHCNTSSLGEQRFSSTFTGFEFFLTDHQVQGQKVLPGVAHLEMVRVAVALALRADVESSVQLDNIVFVRPVVIGDQPLELHIALEPEDNGA